jgi:ornithine carbamoyltransferase
LTLQEFSPSEILGLLTLAQKVKKSPAKFRESLSGQCLAMVFDKSSTRTRVSFEVGMTQLGGHALYLSGNDLQLGRGETTADTARILSGYTQGIMVRTFAHKTVEELAESAKVPVINGLTDQHHPCQILADLLTLLEKFKKLKGLYLIFIGDGNNVAHSLMIGTALVGVNLKVVCPPAYQPDAEILRWAQKQAGKTQAHIEVTHSVKGSVKGADAVYTDVWTSMGQENEKEKRLRDFQGFQVNEELMAESPKALFFHCLPAHRGEEVSAGVIDGKKSVVWDQAENRLYAQKALLVNLMGTQQRF